MEKRNTIVKISRKHLPVDIVKDLILTLDPSFAKRLAEDVNIDAYSLKLSEHADFEVADFSGSWGGVIAFYENKKELYITYVCVSVTKRRMGVADLLLHSVCSYADEVAKPISLEVWTSNAKAIRLYEKHGFEKVRSGTDKFYMTRPCKVSIQQE